MSRHIFIMAVVLGVFLLALALVELIAHRKRKRLDIFLALFAEAFASECGWGFDVEVSFSAPPSLPEPRGPGPFMVVKRNGRQIAAFRFHENATLSGVAGDETFVYASVREAARAVQNAAVDIP